jgi:polyisoprenoid-binding protein YceI
MKTISASELYSTLDQVVLIHVLPEECFENERIPGSLNACVYEVAFISKVEALVDDSNRGIVVYGAGGASHDALTAAEKLTRAGYGNVAFFPGGMVEWKEMGLPTEGDGAGPAVIRPDGVYQVDAESSVLRWTGRNLFNHHHGTLKLLSGRIEVDGGVLRAAHFTIDMNSIVCEDLVDEGYNAMLIRHLRDDDFFSVERYPTAVFTSDHAERIPRCTEGSPNYLLRGALTLRGVTLPISFPAVIAEADADHLTGQAQFEIDRTQFGSHYGSGKWFAFLGKHVVNDHIHLHLKVHAKRV